MSDVTESTTLAEAKALVLANVSFLSEQNLTKAKAFLDAFHAYSLLCPTQAGRGAATMAFNLDYLADLAKQAEAMVKANASGTGITGTQSTVFTAFNNFRD